MLKWFFKKVRNAYRRRLRSFRLDVKRWHLWLCVMGLGLPRFDTRGANPSYIVSLTSYGIRVRGTAPYAIYTLFKQDVRPDRVVLWLDSENWNSRNIPFILKRMKHFGLDIRFCDDLKSYKKLIFALESFPDAHIITADDDLYYPRNWFAQLLATHKEHPNKIICHRADGITVDENHRALPYLKWGCGITPRDWFSRITTPDGKNVPRHQLESVFPTTGGGVLYPPGCLNKAVADRGLFMRLAPRADVIWFWAMAVTNTEFFGGESPFVIVENGYSECTGFVSFELSTGENSLWFHNQKGENDIQFDAVVRYYPQINEVLRKIKPFRAEDENPFRSVAVACHIAEA